MNKSKWFDIPNLFISNFDVWMIVFMQELTDKTKWFIYKQR